jgi:hypothetical protein
MARRRLSLERPLQIRPSLVDSAFSKRPVRSTEQRVRDEIERLMQRRDVLVADEEVADDDGGADAD